MTPSRDLRAHPVWLVDCQATGATPKHGSLLDIAWCTTTADTAEAEAIARIGGSLVRLPDGARVPGHITKLTGIRIAMLRDAPSPQEVAAAARASLAAHDAPPVVVAHYASFEQKFLDSLLGEDAALEIICTHKIARRLLPELPKHTLRAVSGYLGCVITEHKRAAEHVEATITLWSQLVELLREREGIETIESLQEWLATTKARRGARGDHVPMPREVRLALPERPGVYRMLGRRGDVLYVGKATSLKQRVNSYFQGKRGLSDRKLEMIIQVWRLDTTETATPLEAALLESDEIKRLRPPYNISLRRHDRHVVFVNPDALHDTSPTPTTTHTLGPIGSPRRVAEAAWLLDSLRHGPTLTFDHGPDLPTLAAGLDLLTHDLGLTPEARAALTPADLLALATTRWEIFCLEREALDDAEDADDSPPADADADEDDTPPQPFAWTPGHVASHALWLLSRLGRQLARAAWFADLQHATLCWLPATFDPATRRALHLRHATLTTAHTLPADDPIPHDPLAADWTAHDLDAHDRLSVLTAEIKRLARKKHQTVVITSTGEVVRGAGLVERLGRV